MTEFLLSSVGLHRVILFYFYFFIFCWRGRIESFHLILQRNVNSKIARIMLLVWSYTMLQEESSFLTLTSLILMRFGLTNYDSCRGIIQ